MVHKEVCPLCMSEEISLHLICEDHFISKEVFEINNCRACGFLFTRDYPEETDIGAYYDSEEYISHSDTPGGLTNTIYMLVRKIMLRIKRGIIRDVTGIDKGNILDIGSGTGHFADIMKEAGWKVKGIEINKKARDFSINRFGLEVLEPSQISSLEPGWFDCITLWHVLEHFHDPFKYALEIRRLLKPGGICLIALPNSSSFDALYYKVYWAAFDVPRHLWHFNPDTFRIFAEKTGFELVKIRTLPLDVFYISILSENYKGTLMPFITGIIKAKLFAIRSFFNTKRSSSLIYILRKPA